MSPDISPVIIPNFLAGLASLALGSYVLKKNFRDGTSRVFFVLMLVCGIWSMGEFIMNLTKIEMVARIGAVGSNVAFIFIPVALLHFAIIYTMKARAGKKKSKRPVRTPSFIILLYIPAVIVALLLLIIPSLFFTVEPFVELGDDRLIDADGGGLNDTSMGEAGSTRDKGYHRLFGTMYSEEDISQWYFRDINGNGKYTVNDTMPEPIMCIKYNYIFCWEEVPGNDSALLLDHLSNFHNITMENDTDISKQEKNDLIELKYANHSVTLLLLELDEKVTLTLENGEDHEYDVWAFDDKHHIFQRIDLVLFNTTNENITCPAAEMNITGNDTSLDNNTGAFADWIGLENASNHKRLYWFDSERTGNEGYYDEGEDIYLDNGNGLSYKDEDLNEVEYMNFGYRQGDFYMVLILLFFVYIIGSLGYFFKEYLMPKNVRIKKQIRFMIIGLILIISLILFQMVMENIGLETLRIFGDSILTLMISLFFAVAVLKYNLMDVQVIIKKSLTYSIIVLIIAILFTIVGESLEFLTGKLLPEVGELVSNIIAALIVSLSFSPVINYTKKLFNKIFPKLAKYEKEYVERLSAYEATLEAMWADRAITDTETRALGILREKLDISQTEHDEIVKRRRMSTRALK